MSKLTDGLRRTTHFGDKVRTSHLNPVVVENDVIADERKWIKGRREACPEDARSHPLTGLAFSGGGVRSATFNLGFLQAMEECGLLKYVDYLSTVSGGGYIGASLSWFMAQEKGFSFNTSRRERNVDTGEMQQVPVEKRIDWLRRHGEYLTPGRGLDRWALAATVLRGLVLNLLVFVPFVLLVVIALAQPLPQTLQDLLDPLDGTLWSGSTPIWFHLIFVMGIAAVLLLIVSFIVTALLSSLQFNRGFNLRGTATKLSGYLLRFGIVGIVLGLVPLVAEVVHQNLGEWEHLAVGPVTLIAIGSLLLGWKGRATDTESKGRWGGFVTFGLMLLLYSLLLSLYHLATLTEFRTMFTVTMLLSAWLPLLLLVVVANVNHLSMHRYYRDRLMQAFMPYFPPGDEDRDPLDPNQFLLRYIGWFYKDRFRTAAPYHIINANLVTLDSADPRLRARGGDNFIFSPLFCGSERTGYARTKTYLGGTMDLATAFAVSGGAVQANTGATRSRPLAILMSLLNVRLGYWIANPNRTWWWKGNLGSAYWFSYFYVLLEMLGLGLDERHRYVHLSDGGHFENLGLYELIRRRCKYIIVCDATADPNFTYSDLARVSQLVRVDFGAEIEIDTRPLMPQEVCPTDEHLVYSRQPCVAGKVTYRNGDVGTILYIDTCMFKGLPEDIYGYQRHNRKFPDEPTTDQFFNERQFEAYRELGLRTGRWVFAEMSVQELEQHHDNWREFFKSNNMAWDPDEKVVKRFRNELLSRLSVTEIAALSDQSVESLWRLKQIRDSDVLRFVCEHVTRRSGSA